MPKNLDGSINVRAHGLVDNDIDALRHSYVSAVYVIEYGEEKADLLGRLNELITSERDPKMENMDLWNNQVGRSYGKKEKRGRKLFEKLLKALKNDGHEKTTYWLICQDIILKKPAGTFTLTFS